MDPNRSFVTLYEWYMKSASTEGCQLEGRQMITLMLTQWKANVDLLSIFRHMQVSRGATDPMDMLKQTITMLVVQ